jgi:hypothetical protein
MYYLLLFLAAFLLISLFSTNWPVKIYHHYLLKQLGGLLHCEPERKGLTLSSVYSQIDTIYRGREVKIRFVEGAVDSLKVNPGLEIRLKTALPAVIEFYQSRANKREWGHFKRFQTGNQLLDSRWFILTDDLEAAAELWSRGGLADLLINNRDNIDQMLVNRDEVIVRLRRFHSGEKVVGFLERLAGSV